MTHYDNEKITNAKAEAAVKTALIEEVEQLLTQLETRLPWYLNDDGTFCDDCGYSETRYNAILSIMKSLEKLV